MKRVATSFLLLFSLGAPALADVATPAPRPSMTAKDAAEVMGIMLSAKTSYSGDELNEVNRLLAVLNSIAHPAPASLPKEK